MSVQPRYRWLAGLAVAATLLCLLAGTAGPLPDAASPASGLVPAVVVSCPGPMLPHNYTGAVSVWGTAVPPPTGIEFTYHALATIAFKGGAPQVATCVAEEGNATSAANGTVAFSIDWPPPAHCSQDLCTTYTGPYESVALAASPLPAGDFGVVASNGSEFTARVAPYLATVSLAPGPSSATFSPGAVDAVRAFAWTGDGNATPLPVNYSWSLTGVGWSFAGAPSGALAEVRATPGAAAGNLTVGASVTLDGSTFTRSTGETLLAVATAIESAGLNRTTIDAGQSVAATVSASGAPGAPYSATVDPGLGGPSETVPCTAANSTGGAVALSCPATIPYPTAGTAQPTVTVTNGVSSASWAFPEVTVAPPPALVVSPGAPVGYANGSLPITVSAVAGSGVGPYAEACLAPGDGPTVCATTPGPQWTFDPTYARPGNYTATAWTVDAVGTSRALNVTVRVVAPLALSLERAAGTAQVGVPLRLLAEVAGGDLPARFWWNDTGTAAPIATGTVATDGALRATFVPTAVGYATVSLAVVDGLGSDGVVEEELLVDVGPATSAAPVALPPTAPVAAGTPFDVAWQALDAGGDSVRDFASAAEVELSLAANGRPVPGSVTVSGVGPLASPVPGWFDVPAGAWTAGELNASVAADVAGSVEVSLTVAVPLPEGAPGVSVSIGPDLDHLVLTDPREGSGGARSGSTLFAVSDRFGNPAPGAVLEVDVAWPGGGTVSRSVSFVAPNGTAEAWVNWSAPGAWAATVTVTDLAGDVLLAPVSVPGLAGPLAYLPVLPLAGAAAVGPALGGVAYARRRTPRDAPAGPRPDAEEELRRLAEGRAEVVELVRRAGSIDLPGLEAVWAPPPAPADLADWVASLLTDGTIDARFGPDGVARFFVPDRSPDAPVVTLDVATFDLAEARRAALADEREPEER